MMRLSWRKQWVIRAALAIAAGWLAALGLASFLIVSDPLAAADAIYVMGGDTEVRVAHAAHLYHERMAPKVLVPAGAHWNPGGATKPPADEPMRILLETVVWRPGTRAGEGFQIAVPVSNRRHHVYVYAIENHKSNFRAMDIKLEGVTRANGIGDLSAGEWRRYGPYEAEVKDGVLDVDVLSSGKGDPSIAGLALYEVKSGQERFVKGVNLGGPRVLVGAEIFAAAGEKGGAATVRNGSYYIPEDLFRSTAAQLRGLGVPGEAITEFGAPSTIDSTFNETESLARYLETSPAKRLIVVTSPFHTRRARRTIDRAIHGRNVDILMSPALHSLETKNGWWRSGSAIKSLASEYVKLAYYSIAH